jgi:hypothetical protein
MMKTIALPAARTIALPQNNRQQINADAADIDLNAAYYVEQTHHATNATAWMITGATCQDSDQMRLYVTKGHPAAPMRRRAPPFAGNPANDQKMRNALNDVDRR